LKVYVNYYGETPEAERPRDPLRPGEIYDIQFNREPVWRIEGREEAEWRLNELRSMQVHVNQHCCDLEIEELPEGQFAICCANHAAF
jgi:hypothetical protein